MKKCYQIFMTLVLLISLFACKQTQKENEEIEMSHEELLDKAERIHQSVITIDTHCDINVNNFTDEKNYTTDIESQVTLPKMERGGLDVAWFIVYTGQGELNEEGYKAAYENAISKFDAIKRLCETYAPEQIALATTSEEVRKIHGEGKLVAMIGVENAYPLGTDLSRIEEFYNRGARYMSLAHQGHSQLSDSNTGEAENEWLHNGLSEMGKEAVVEMNRLGMMIDVSHPSKAAIAQMLEISKAPVIASHSSARALNDHSRNLDDEQLKAIAENGGVIQTVAFKTYVHQEKQKRLNEFKDSISKSIFAESGNEWLNDEDKEALSEEERTKYDEQWRNAKVEMEELIPTMDAVPEEVSVSDFVDHIDYMVELIGIEHVGISSDFDGGGGLDGWEDAGETLNVTTELVRRGYTEKEIRKLWGDNLLRVLDEVQEVADSWN